MCLAMTSRMQTTARGVSARHCSMCVFEATTYQLLLNHLRLVHANDPGFSFPCGVDGCCQTLKSFSSLYQHIYRNHKSSGIIQSRGDVLTPVITQTLESRSCDRQDGNQLSSLSQSTSDSSCDIPTGFDDPDLQHLLGGDAVQLQRSSALFLLKMKEVHKLPQTALNDVVEGFKTVFTQTAQQLHCEARAKLASIGMNQTLLDDTFKNLIYPFDGLETRYHQEKYFKNNFNLVEPQEVFVGEEYYPARFSGNKRSLVCKRDSFQYIPLQDSLKVLLNDKTVLDFVNHPHQRSDDFLEDICDAEIFKNHPIFAADPLALQIIAYIDELEVCNPLGTHTKKHKLTIILFTLGNIPSKYRSRLKVINLVTCATHSVVEEHGIDAILKPFVDDLNVLASRGITLSVDGISQTFKGGLLCFLGDNVALNAIGGFKESFSSTFRFCRTCLATVNTFRDHFLSQFYTQRTDSTHQKHCDDIQGPLKYHYSKTYGINRRSTLLDISHFTLCGGLPHDFMHDVLEGIAQHEMKLLLRHSITENFITITEYNRRIVFFDYGKNESDKPGIITHELLQSEDKKFHLSASQALLLCRILPFLIGDCIPESDPYWHCFILLLKILDIITAPVISKGQCSVLKNLIEEHHSMFKQLYKACSLMPKAHFMIHYPEQIIALGPMVCSWTMRYEAKLSLFKKASHLGNFKNIAKTLAERHQQWMCYHLASGKLLQSGFECGPGKETKNLRDMPAELVSHIQNALPGVSIDIPIYHSNWVKKYGNHYDTNNCFVLIGSDGIDPIFGQVVDIYVACGDTILLHNQHYKTTYYDEHFHSFMVHATPVTSVINVEDLPSYCTMHSHKLFNGSSSLYITLKHHEFFL